MTDRPDETPADSDDDVAYVEAVDAAGRIEVTDDGLEETDRLAALRLEAAVRMTGQEPDPALIARTVALLRGHADPLPEACMNGTCGCPPQPDGYDQHVVLGEQPRWTNPAALLPDEQRPAEFVTVEGDFIGVTPVIRIHVQGDPVVTFTVEDALAVADTIPGIVRDLTDD